MSRRFAANEQQLSPIFNEFLGIAAIGAADHRDGTAGCMGRA